MAQRVKVILVDDLDSGEADETVRFGLDGATYEVDLSTAHAQELRQALEPYLSVARRAGGRISRGLRSATRNQETAKIRKWAKDQGYNVSDRGRIQADIIEAYRKANG